MHLSPLIIYLLLLPFYALKNCFALASIIISKTLGIKRMEFYIALDLLLLIRLIS